MASPTAAKTAEKVADNNSFTTVANQWFEHWRDGKSSRHINSTRRRLDTNIFPSLGMLQTAKIKAPDVVAMVKVIEARGAHDIAKRAMGTTGLDCIVELSEFFERNCLVVQSDSIFRIIAQQAT